MNTSTYGHWTCIFKYKNKNIVEIFDSYGKPIDYPLKYSNYSKKAVKGNKILSKLLFHSKYEIEYNDYKFQNDESSTCGRWVIHRLLNKNIDIYKYIQFWKKFKFKDYLISYIII